jgi:Mrp family chromosome partitioning ATPase
MTLQIPPGGGSSPPLAYADTEPDGVPTVNDPAMAMLALILQSRGAQSAAATQDANHAKEMMDQTRRQIQEATKRAAEAEENKGFWDKLGAVFSGEIGTLCEIVAAVAVSVATGGVGAAGALALTAAALSASGEVAKRAGASPVLCAVLSGAGALAGLAVGNVAGASALCTAVTDGAKVVHFAADASGIGATVVAQQWEATALDRQADATAARGQQSVALFDYDLALDALERAVRDTTRAQTTTANIVQTENEGRLGLIARLGAA